MTTANHKHLIQKTFWKLLPCFVLISIGLYYSTEYGGITSTSKIQYKLINSAGVLIFVIFAFIFLSVLSKAVKKAIINSNLGRGRAAAAEFLINIFGYLVILFTALDHLGIAVGHLLLGSAILGIILGVAAQQALANVFASIVLIVSHPFTVGQEITVLSGGLGGKYEGTVIDIGVTHTRIREKDDNIIAFPNAALLTGATIRRTPPKPKD
jgi:small-conductance mechanosensitive channel